jgi:hypothetical protein
MYSIQFSCCGEIDTKTSSCPVLHQSSDDRRIAPCTSLITIPATSSAWTSITADR